MLLQSHTAIFETFQSKPLSQSPCSCRTQLRVLLTELQMKNCDADIQHHKHKACTVSASSGLTIQSHDWTHCAPGSVNIRLSGLSSRLLIGHSFCLTTEEGSPERRRIRPRLCKRKVNKTLCDFLNILSTQQLCFCSSCNT